MLRLEEFVNYVRQGNSLSSIQGTEELSKLHAELVKEYKKSTPQDLDMAFNALDMQKQSSGVALILSAKAANTNCSLDKLLQQTKEFMAPFIAEGIDIFQAAIAVCQAGNIHMLTEVHSLYLQVCMESNHWKMGLDLLNTEIYQLPTRKDLDMTSCMNYFLYASIVLSAFHYFQSALANLEMIFHFPNFTNTNTVSAITVYKKYIVLTLLTDGKSITLSKSVLGQMESALKRNIGPYIAVQEAFNAEAFDFTVFSNLVNQHANVFNQDGNGELAQLCIRKYKTKELAKYAKVFENIPIDTVMAQLGILTLDVLESHLVDMEQYSDFAGRIDEDAHVISFSKQSDRTSTELMLETLQNTVTELQSINDVLLEVDREISTSADYLRHVMGDPVGRDYFPDMGPFGNGGMGFGGTNFEPMMAYSGNGSMGTRSGRPRSP